MSTQNLAVDIGNSRIKLGVFRDDEMLENIVFSGDSSNEGILFVEKYIPYRNIIFSNVNEESSEFINYLKGLKVNLVEFNNKTDIPVSNLYKSPHTLGKDRLAGVIGARSIFPDSNVLVIDAGTAITFDFIHSSGEYYGGNISPGLEMRFRALHEFTSRLPKLSVNEKFTDTGYDTDSSIISGVQKGMIYEIEGYILNLSENFDEFNIILTGGDADFFDKKLKYTIFVVPSLILVGLNHVLRYHETLSGYYP